MKARAWLVLEVEEVRSYGRSEYRAKIAKVRQTQPLNEINVRVDLEIPDDFIMPKVEAVVEREGQVMLTLEEVEPVTFGGEE